MGDGCAAYPEGVRKLRERIRLHRSAQPCVRDVKRDLHLMRGRGHLPILSIIVGRNDLAVCAFAVDGNGTLT